MRIAYFENGRAEILGSARASRAGDRALAIADFSGRATTSPVWLLVRSSLRRDAAASTRDACATQNRAMAARGMTS
jgi:hypothetical protein